MEQTSKPQYNVRQNVRFMVACAWRMAKSVLWLCLASVVLQLGIDLAQLYLAPVVLGKVEHAAPLTQLLGTIALFSLLLVLLHGLLGYVKCNTIFGRVDVRSGILQDLNDKACTTSYPNTRDPKVLKLQEKALNACNGNSEPTEHVWETLTNLVLNGAGFLIYLSLLSGLNFFLILVIVATTAAGFALSKRVNEWGYRHREQEAEYQKKLSYLRSRAQASAVAKDIRIFGLKPWLDDLYDSTMNLYAAFIQRREKVYIWSCVADVVLGFCRNGIAYGYLIHLALTKDLSAAEFLLYFNAFSGFSAWVTGILTECSTLHKESIAISTVQEYLNYPEQFRFEDGAPVPKAERYELRLKDVSFRYPGSEKQTISHMDLTIRPGEKLAVVGLNGAGKTTLVKLLCGFYDPDEGQVLLNGRDIREFDRRAYYKLFSAVFQDFSALDVTVSQAVAQKVSGIDMARVKDCIGKAGLSEKVESLPKGYETHLGKRVHLDGVELSGGQDQRLMLARALYKDGPILVLDEPTAALDPIAENDIYMKYNRMTEGKTSVFISHRLASTRFCDRIVFIRDGVIAEEGTHEELIRMDGGYAKLFEIQARYYQEGGEAHGEEI